MKYFDIWATGALAPTVVEIFLGRKNDSYTGKCRKPKNRKKKRHPLWIDVSREDCRQMFDNQRCIMILQNLQKRFFVKRVSDMLYRIEIDKGNSIYIQDNDIKNQKISFLNLKYQR